MTTQAVVQGYLDSMKQKKKWDSFLADDMVFTSFTSPVRRIVGKHAFIEATKNFYSSLLSAEVLDLLVQGNKACALTHYRVQWPGHAEFVSDVAEIFTVTDGKISSFDIYFDSAPFPK